MSVRNKAGCHVPKLRFPEFRESGEWEEKLLAMMCNVLQGYGFPEILQGKSEGKYPFCKVSDASRAVTESGGLLTAAANYVGDDELLKLRAKPIPKGATVFAKIGEALRLNRRAFVQNECLIDNNLTGLKAIDGIADDYFVYQLSQLIDLNRHCGGAVPSVNKSTLEEVRVVVPGYDEQKRIADCLASLDELITLEAQKLDALKAHNKGLMQQLFPAEGETLPQRRFPAFRDSGRWEISPLSKYASSLDAGVSVVSGDRPAGSGQVGILKTSSVTDGVFNPQENKIVLDEAELQRLKEPVSANSIIISRMNTPALVGANAYVAESLENIFLPDRLWALKPRPNTSIRFIGFVLSSQKGRSALSELATGTSGSMKNITKSDVLALEISAPSFAEQQKIADCLASLDDLITAQTRKLAALKTHKKGLMQQLFPNTHTESTP